MNTGGVGDDVDGSEVSSLTTIYDSDRVKTKGGKTILKDVQKTKGTTGR